MGFVERVLQAACAAGASDVHLQPVDTGLEVRWRIDGVLQRVGTFPVGEASDIVARLKVLAELLTYRRDIPQEGRIRDGHTAVEMRVSTFPTLFGERAVVRVFSSEGRHLHLDELRGLVAGVANPPGPGSLRRACRSAPGQPASTLGTSWRGAPPARRDPGVS